MLLSLKAESHGQKHLYENEFFISEVYPNPFKNETTVIYYVPHNCLISFKVYDATGRLMQSENIGSTIKGKHQCILHMPESTPGVYYIILETNGNPANIKKIVVN